MTATARFDATPRLTQPDPDDAADQSDERWDEPDDDKRQKESDDAQAAAVFSDKEGR